MSAIPRTTPQQINTLKEYFQFLENAGFSGQVQIAEKGQMIKRQDFGMANRETKQPVTSTTAFNIASLTKQFTATAILLLEQEGKLNCGDTLGKFWDTLSEEKKAISIHQLLTHKSGFKRQLFPTGGKISKTELISKIFTEPLQSKPGISFQYSNTGYEVLAAIIEHVSGISYTEFIRHKFILPYGLIHTYFNTDDLKDINHEIAIGYNEWKEINYPILDSQNWNNTGASNILSTDNDMMKWFSLILNNKVLSASQTQKLFSAAENEEYGYGWYVTKTDDNERLIYHGGDLAGFHSELLYYPDRDRVIYIITNADLFGYGISKYRIEENVPKILRGESIDFPLNSVKYKPEILYKYCGTYQFDSSNYYKVWINGEQLTMGASGQTAINLSLSKKSRHKLNLDSVCQISFNLLNFVLDSTKENGKDILSGENFNFYFPFLKEKIISYSKAMDGMPVISVAGTIPAYWRGSGMCRTYLNLKFQAGSTPVYLGWGPKGLYDITFNDDRPFPLIYPLVCLSESNVLIYDIDHSNVTPIQFTLDQKKVIKSLSIKDDDGRILLFKKIK